MGTNPSSLLASGTTKKNTVMNPKLTWTKYYIIHRARERERKRKRERERDVVGEIALPSLLALGGVVAARSVLRAHVSRQTQ
jgi:hypothetical protein